jgi:hypothetical protein
MIQSKPMQFKDKFKALAKAAEVTQDEQGVAEFFWYAGLQYAFQRGTSEPALLRASLPQAMTANSTAMYDHNYPNSKTHDGYLVLEEDDNQLTAHEAKLLVLMLREHISELQDIQSVMTDAVSRTMQVCTPDGSQYQESLFYLLNKGRDKLRQVKEKVKVVSEVQRKLKKQSRGS